MRKPLQLAGLAACLVAGILLATALVGSVHAAGNTTVETTSEPTTVFSTETVEQTTTRQIILPAPTTTSSSSSSSETPTWVWVLLAILAVALIIVIAILALRGGGGGGDAVSPAERRRRLDGAVASWATQGWALESQSADSAVLQRAAERMIVSVDAAGQVSTRPSSAGPPA